jgi:7-cyano-7-deazaguanine synthase
MSLPSNPAIVLVSGGLDSATALAVAKQDGFMPHALTFSYGQRQIVEVAAARRIAAAVGAYTHRVIDIDLKVFGHSALTADIPVPKDRALSKLSSGVPLTYVPARNTIFLAYALAYAEVTGAFDIFLGVNAVDYSGYPDCRPEFIAAFERLANLATRASIDHSGHFTLHAPLIQMTKAEIILLGTKLKVDYSLTHSCYDPIGELACGRCDACLLRKRGFVEAGISDPTRYAEPAA